LYGARPKLDVLGVGESSLLRGIREAVAVCDGASNVSVESDLERGVCRDAELIDGGVSTC
jgi:hypothetical protein